MLRINTSLGFIALATFLLICARMARADTVVLKNGSSFTGSVTMSGDSYTIQTKFGSFTVAADQVSEWRKENSKDNNDGTSKDAPPARIHPAPPPDVVLPPPADLSETQRKAEAALAIGDGATAISLLSAPSKGSHDVRLLHTLGLACLQQHQAHLAMITLERAVNAAGENITRALAINTAVAELQTKYPGRAIKTLYDYLKLHQKDKDVDEQVLNALGIALTQADDSTRGSRLFSDAATLYMSCNSTLESTRPGFKRFGKDWYPTEEADRKLKEFNDAVSRLNQAQSNAAAADQNVSNAYAVVQQSLMTLGGRGPDRNAANQAYQRALNDQRTAYDRVRSCAQDVHSPFPSNLDTVAMDSVTPGDTVASATGSSNNPPPKPKVTVPDPPVIVNKPNDHPPTVTSGGLFQPTSPVKPKPTSVPSASDYAAAFPVADQLLVTSAAIATNVKELSVQGSDGVPIKATVVRVDKASGLALIRVSNMRLTYLNLADQFAGGQFDCPGFSDVDLFNPAPAMLSGTAPAPGDHWTLNFDNRPKLSGSPLLCNGEVVGVELITGDAKPDQASGVTLDTLRKFVGDDLPHGPPSNADPLRVVWQVVANHN